MVDGARLESVCRLTPTVGSNPTLTAIDPARLAPAAAGSRKLLQGIVSSNAPVGSGRRRYFGLETPQVLMPRIA